MFNLDEYIAQVEAGYSLLSRSPYLVPEVQDKIVSRVVCGTHNSYAQVQASVGAEGVQYAHRESLACIRTYLGWFYEFDGTVVTIPDNALTVSFALPGFAAGDSCNEFPLANKEMPKEFFFTYRMISKQCQATFYNEGGVEFLAGFCYYLQPKDASDLTTSVDEAVMRVTTGGNIPYPHVSRWDTWRFKAHRKYGRDCEKAGKRVQVNIEEGKHAVHQVYNYHKMCYEFEECEECREEAKTYKFVPMKVVPASKEESEKEEPVEIEEKLEELHVESDDSDYDFVEDLEN